MITKKLLPIILVMIPITLLVILIIVSEPMSTDPMISYDKESVIAAGSDEEAFTVKEKKYSYKGGGVMILSVENNTDKNYTVNIIGHMFAENGVEISTVKKTFTGFPAGSRNYFVFRTYVMFDTFEYAFYAAEYERETYADCIKFTSDAVVEFEPWSHDIYGKPYDEYRTVMYVKYPFTSECFSETSFSYSADFVLFDNTGEIYLIDSLNNTIISPERSSKQYVQHIKILPQSYLWGSYKIPPELKGRLKGIVALRSVRPYEADQNVNP